MGQVSPDLSFLPTAVYHVAILDPQHDDHPPVCRHFGSDREAAEKWLAEWNRKGWNCHFTVNEIIGGLNEKPAKDDIVGLRAVHSDVDHRDNFDRLRDLQPSIIIDSGGGYQPLWFLQPHDRSHEAIEALSRRTVMPLAADRGCYNADRLLRVPGTVNWPNARKRRNGRFPVLAKIAHKGAIDVWEVGDLDDWFSKHGFLLAGANVDRKRGPDEVELGPYDPIRADQLAPPLSARTLALCQEAGHADRSVHVSRVVAALAAEGRSREEIAALLACPENEGLHGHIADQKDPERAIRRKVALGEGKRPSDRFAVPAVLPPSARQLSEGPPPAVMEVVAASTLAGKPVPVRRWIVPGLIPDRTVTDIAADGGTGKSMLMLQLATAVATGSRWLDIEVERGPVLYFSAEDELDEVHRRLDVITRAEGVSLASLGDLLIAPMAGRDSLLVAPAGKGLTVTTLAHALHNEVAARQPKMVIIDTRADVFGGNELDRTQVRQFVSLLAGLCLRYDCAVVLISHPSLTGMATGSGQSGSTGWGNSVRSRLYLERHGNDPDARILTTKKTNYGTVGDELQLRWVDGVFRLTGRSDRSAATAARLEQTADDKFIELLALLRSQGRTPSTCTGHNYAPTMMAGLPDNHEGIPKDAFRKAMERLLSAGKIKITQVGKPSRQKECLEIVT